MDFRFKPSIAPVKKIKAIQFSVISPEHIKNTSVTQPIYDLSNKKLPEGIFDHNRIYDQTTRKPVIGGLNDPRMGSVTDLDNPGYFGHIPLARPVYHYGYLNFVIEILRCVSFYTSKLLLSNEQIEIIKSSVSRKKRLKEISKNSLKVKVCRDTKRLLPVYTKDSLKILVEHFDMDMIGDMPEKRSLSPIDAYGILEKISDEDVITLGFDPKFARPEWFLVSVVNVPPPHVRPAVSMSSIQRCEDDLTHKINDILKSNLSLQMALDNNSLPHVIEQHENLLQYNVATFFDNNISGQKPSQQRSGKPLKTITQRLTGKDGRIRGNLMGKRVDFSARTVITADPNISIDEVGVPRQIALNLTIPEKVTKFNINKLQELVNNGPNIHPGARYIVKTDGKKIDLKFAKFPPKLENGFTVERHLDNGDIVLFNRQPSLHKMSIMAHKVRVLEKGLTFRLNLACTSPYNADFDGDEMNLHVPQSMTARSEAENLMIVHKLIVGAQSNKPMMGIIQDSLLASSKMSRRDTFIEKDILMNLMMYFPDFMNSKIKVPEPTVWLRRNGVLFPLWTGKQILSLLIPKGLNYLRKSNDAPDNDTIMTPSDTRVFINNGLIISGIIDKKSIGTSEGSLIHIIFNDYGDLECKKFMDTIQRVVNYWILQNSFSIGIGDTITDSETSKEIDKILLNISSKVDNLISTSSNDARKLEKLINNELNGARDEAGRIAQNKLSHNNNFKATVSAGSKGNTLNISQIMACVGQQNIEGQRVAYGFNKRTLPHYSKNDIGKESRGFIENSYLKGLTPQEFFFHSMAGREGLIDTACKSVIGSTEILIYDELSNKTRVVEIGKYIDEMMDNPVNKNLIEHQEERQMELLKLKEKVYIPNVDKKGKVTWNIISQVTRHDPGEYLYEVVTEGGRKVTVTESNSLLVWRDNEFKSIFTEEAKIGDKVPVSMFLPEPPKLNTHVNLSDYLSKKEFLYGTDYKKAIELMEKDSKIVNGFKQIPNGWWASNNGINFTLPYENKAKLARANSGRSDMSNVKEGYVYPFSKNRSNGLIPDKFEFTHDNGVFLGLYLAEGHVSNYRVQVTNNDKGIRNFVKNWFEKMGLVCTERIKQTEIPTTIGGVTRGTSSHIEIYSIILGTFLKKFVGHLSQNKFVPEEINNAPLDFVRGLLNGYFSGDGCVSEDGSITCSSVSEKLIHGISSLCSRFGIFGKISEHQSTHNNVGSKFIHRTYILSIRAQWARLFAQKIPLMIDYKQERLNQNLVKKNLHQTYKQQNDVVFDRIKSINKIDSKDYPKVYDMTVPGNFTFMTSSNIYINDTSSTGYSQRRMAKVLEDVIVNYDKTVRDNSSSIVNFLYGDDDMDGTYVETQLFDYEGILGSLDLTEGERIQLSRDKELFDRIMEHKGSDSKFLPVPVNIKRLMMMAFNDLELKKMEEKVNYDYLKEFIDKFDGTELFRMHMRLNLNSSTLKNFNNRQLLYVFDRISYYYNKFRITPGEMCGIIASQAIGEASTQLCLNTFHSSGISTKNVNLGIPRLNELLNVSKNIKSPSMTCYLRDQKDINTIVNKLEYKTIKDLILTATIKEISELSSENEYKFLKYYDEFDNFLREEEVEELEKFNYVLILLFNNELLESSGVTMNDILVSVLDLKYRENNDSVNIRISHDNVSRPMLIVSLNRNEGESNDDLFSKLHLYHTDKLNKIKLQGIEGITKVFIEKSGGMKHIETSGSNMIETFRVKELDHTRTICNDIIETLNTLGIEAARKILFDEIKNVISFDGTVINYRHILMVVDIMTFKGVIIPTTRHGLRQSAESSTLMRCSFEETVDTLIESSAYSKCDLIKGVSENIILGQLAPFGTGYFDVLFNKKSTEEYLKKKTIFDKIEEEFRNEEVIEKVIENDVIESDDESVYNPDE